MLTMIFKTPGKEFDQTGVSFLILDEHDTKLPYYNVNCNVWLMRRSNVQKFHERTEGIPSIQKWISCFWAGMLLILFYTDLDLPWTPHAQDFYEMAPQLWIQATL